jgi:hypothetical protein
MSEVDVPLLIKVLDHITAHPEEWDQETWAIKTSCGTACCVAGHAVVMAGHTLQFGSYYPGTSSAMRVSDGRSIENVARQELGLSVDQADLLFNSSNTLYNLWWIACDLTDGAIQVPEGLS